MLTNDDKHYMTLLNWTLQFCNGLEVRQMKFAFEYQCRLADVLMHDLCQSLMAVTTPLVLLISLACGPLWAVLCSVILDVHNHVFLLVGEAVVGGLYTRDLELFYNTTQPKNMKIQEDNHTGLT